MAVEDRKPLLIQVQVLERTKEEDEVIQDYNVNFSHYDTKLWLTRLFVWAMLNDKVVELSPIHVEPSTVRLFTPQPEGVM